MPAKVTRGLILASLLLWPMAGRAQTDIVWPTYAQAKYVADLTMTCEQLHGTITHVTADIALLTKARDRVGDIVRNRFDFDASVGRVQDRQFTAATSAGGQELYTKAREQIVASRRVAVSRLDFLNSLVPACKEAPAAP